MLCPQPECRALCPVHPAGGQSMFDRRLGRVLPVHRSAGNSLPLVQPPQSLRSIEVTAKYRESLPPIQRVV